jgi:hypothetical protein
MQQPRPSYSFYSAPHHYAPPRPAPLSFCTWTLTTASMRCIALLPADVSSCGFYPIHMFVCCLPACPITYFVSGIYTYPPPSTRLLNPPPARTYLPASRSSRNRSRGPGEWEQRQLEDRTARPLRTRTSCRPTFSARQRRVLPYAPHHPVPGDYIHVRAFAAL